MKYFWKVRRVADGKYHSGSYYQNFTKHGKVYVQKGSVTTLIRHWAEAGVDITGMEVVEFILTEVIANPATDSLK